MEVDRRTALMILAALPGLGPVHIRKLDEKMDGKVEQLLGMDVAEQRAWCSERIVHQLSEWRHYFNPSRDWPELAKIGADFVTFEESDYPERLRTFSDRPIGLYRCNATKRVPLRTIAIVGTRAPSAYGCKVARQFAHMLSRIGFSLASGLADGVDTIVHQAALDAGGETIAVLGGGLMRCYPASNRMLLEAVQASGGAWTEFPLWRRADRRSFPQRNRIVSGISEAVVVIESGPTGGSLITARMASEQGKPVYVIPGRIDAIESAGCHALIRDGAQLVTSVEEVLNDLNFLPGICAEVKKGQKASISTSVPEEGVFREIWDVLGEGYAHPDAVSAKLNRSAADVACAMLEMELEGYLGRRLDGCYERV